jgi:hypothetical protein
MFKRFINWVLKRDDAFPRMNGDELFVVPTRFNNPNGRESELYAQAAISAGAPVIAGKMCDVIIWFEDCTRHTDRVFNETGVASQGMQESCLDKFMQANSVSVIEKQYVKPGLLSGVRLSYQERSVSIDFESDLRHLAQELGTNPWIRNAEELQYLEFWNSGKPLF